MPTFRDVYRALMVANDKKQLDIARSLEQETNGMVHDVLVAGEGRRRQLPMGKLEQWIQALGTTTPEQRRLLRDLAWDEYAPEWMRGVRSMAIANLAALRELRAMALEKFGKVPQSVDAAIQDLQRFVGE